MAIGAQHHPPPGRSDSWDAQVARDGEGFVGRPHIRQGPLRLRPCRHRDCCQGGLRLGIGEPRRRSHHRPLEEMTFLRP